MFVQMAHLHNILPRPQMLTWPSLFAASGPLRPSHQESPDPGPADPEPGHEGGDRCLYPGERLGGGLLKWPLPPMSPSYPRYSTRSLDNTRLWRSDRPLPGYVLYTSGKSHTMDYQNGSHVSRSASSSPHFIFAVKRSCSKLPRLVVHGPQLPLNPPSSCSFYLPSFPLYHAVPSLSSQTPFFTQNKGPRSQVSLAPPPILSLSRSLSLSLSLYLSLSATILGKHQHCTPVFHRSHQYKKITHGGWNH